MKRDPEPTLVLRLAFRAYKSILSPILHAISPTQCKFLPTCSEYTYIALSRHGLLRGTALACIRISHCHPWAEGGLDPVPSATRPHSE